MRIEQLPDEDKWFVKYFHGQLRTKGFQMLKNTKEQIIFKHKTGFKCELLYDSKQHDFCKFKLMTRQPDSPMWGIARQVFKKITA